MVREADQGCKSNARYSRFDTRPLLRLLDSVAFNNERLKALNSMITHDVSSLPPTGFSGDTSNQDLERFMVERNISTEAQKAAAGLDGVRGYKAMIPPIERRFERSNIDLISAMSVRQYRICIEHEFTMV